MTRTIDELSRLQGGRSRHENERLTAFYVRLGRIVGDPSASHMMVSRSIQIAKTWRGHFAWRLAAALRRRAA